MCNEEMEIQKVFSDIEGEERYYSVLMTEEELALFSDIQKEFSLNFSILGKKIGIGLNERDKAAKMLKNARKISQDKFRSHLKLNPKDLDYAIYARNKRYDLAKEGVSRLKGIL